MDTIDRGAQRQAELNADALRDWRRRQGAPRRCGACGGEIPDQPGGGGPGRELCAGCQDDEQTGPGLWAPWNL